jgi:AraC-like DNA-binding protein
MRIKTNSIVKWQHEICRHVLALDFKPASDSQFCGSLSAILNANGVSVTQIGHTPGQTYRDQVMAKDGTDTVALLVAAGGAMHVSHRGREVQLGAGQATVLRNWEPGQVALSREGHYNAVIIPNSALERSDVIDAMVGRRLPGTTALNLTRSYVSSLRTGRDGAHSELAQLASAHLIDLVCLALTMGTERAEKGESENIGEARLRVALETIAERHCELGLCVNDVAAAQGISPRYLQKLLERKGISFSGRVNDLRLQTAHAALIQREAQSRSIADVALSCGFQDISYFNRLFRRCFGDTPTGVRAAAGGHE